MDDLWTTVSPGGVAFTPPTPGDVNDWAPDAQYGTHPAHVIAGDGDGDGDGEEPATEFDTTSDSAVEEIAAAPTDGQRIPHLPVTEDAPIEEQATDTSPAQDDLGPDGTSRSKATPTIRISRALILTGRDLEIFCFLARHRMATYDQLALAFDTTTNALRQRLPRLHASGYLIKKSFNAPAIAVWMVTKEGMKRAEVDLPVATFTTVYEHTLGLTDLAIKYARLGITVLTEVEIRAGERTGARQLPGLPRFVSPHVQGSRHRPDLVLYYPSDTPGKFRCVAVELELTRKGPKRLRPILRAYRRADGIEEVRYYTPHREIAKDVAKATKAVGLEHMVTIKKFIPGDGARASGR